MSNKTILLSAALAVLAPAAHADLILTATPSAAPTGGGGIFDVTLTDTGGTYVVDTFEYELTVPTASGIEFTGDDMNTDPGDPYTYIFANNSLDGAGTSVSLDTFPTQDVTGSDTANTGNGTTLGIGDVYGLGDIAYTVDPGATPGPVAVTFNADNTLLTDASSNAIPFTTQDGTIIVANASPAPEPSEVGILALVAYGLGGLLLRARRRSPA